MANLKFEHVDSPLGAEKACVIGLYQNDAGLDHRIGSVSECTSIRALAAEVEQLKRDLDTILRQGREFFGPTSIRVSRAFAHGLDPRDEMTAPATKLPARSHRTLVAARRKVLRQRLLRRQKKLAKGSGWRRWLRIRAPSTGSKMKSAELQLSLRANDDLLIDKSFQNSNLRLHSAVDDHTSNGA